MLEVVDVAKRYGDHDALHGVSLSVRAGEVCGLLGPNGAGKTTLVSIIAGLRSPDARSGARRRARHRRARPGRPARPSASPSQETAIYPTVTVRENLELFTRLAGYSGAGVAKRLEEVAEVVELTDFLDRQARNLSGGEQRRLHTAMALVHRPKVLMLDEPTTGVDIATAFPAARRDRRAHRGRGLRRPVLHPLPARGRGAGCVGRDPRPRPHPRPRARSTSWSTQHGSGLVELTFDGPAPELPGATVDGSVARVATDRPGVDAAALVGGLGDAADRLVSVDLSRPSLETVFLAVTGRAYCQRRRRGAGAGEPHRRDRPPRPAGPPARPGVPDHLHRHAARCSWPSTRPPSAPRWRCGSRTSRRTALRSSCPARPCSSAGSWSATSASACSGSTVGAPGNACVPRR